ncbi:MAG: peptidoglycan-binding protein [Bacteroidia bacterium]|nr:peptidoglycan-binding protein [Bacteroidia bacterium]NNM16573.1 peptidoglycan-binding protein [Bacteroidia bacterium]
MLPVVLVNAQDLPPNAEPGKCYAKCVAVDEYKTETVTVQTKAASKRIESIPAVYETITEQVIAKEASTRIEVIPAVYETVTEEVVDTDASTRIVSVPAVYETVTETIVIAPATTKWVKGKADPNCLSANPDDCRVMCLVDVPEKTKTVSKRVLKTPATSNTVDIPAKYKTVSRKALKTPAATRSVEVPAVYKTVSKRVLKTPAATREIEIPAEYRDVTKTVLVNKGGWSGWKEVVCAQQITPKLIRAVQAALEAKGYDVGPHGLDNIMGVDTKAALRKFQTDNKLPVGNLNIETMSALGVAGY